MEAQKEGPDRRRSHGRWWPCLWAFRLARPAVKFPTADVKRKEFIDYLEVKGEIKALRSVVITAPYGAGDLQIMKLAANGAKVKKGDVLG